MPSRIFSPPGSGRLLRKAERRAIYDFSAEIEDDVAGLLPGFDIAGRLDYLVEGVRAVDHRPIGVSLDHRGERLHVLLPIPGDPELHAFADEREKRRVPHETAVHRDVQAVRLQRAAAAAIRALADTVEDEVVSSAARGVVHARVVEDLVCAQRARELEGVRTADRGDVRSLVLGDLDGRGADRAGRAVDDDPLAGLQARLA